MFQIYEPNPMFYIRVFKFFALFAERQVSMHVYTYVYEFFVELYQKIWCLLIIR